MPTIFLTERATDLRDASGKEPQIAGRIRLLLAVAGFSAVFLEARSATLFHPQLGPAFGGYVLFSCIAYLAGEWRLRTRLQRHLLWADCAWIAVVVALSGGADSVFFAYFMFPVLVASLRSGFSEGALVTLFAVLSFLLASGAVGNAGSVPLLLFRATCLLALGYLIARLGGDRCQLQRRLELLHGLAPLANPCLGVDRTITAMLSRTRSFFDAERCVTVVAIGGRFLLRSVGRDGALAAPAEPIDPGIAAQLLAGGRDATLLFKGSWRALPAWLRPPREEALEQAAELLGAGSFVAAPLSLRGGYGRVFVVRPDRELTRADAAFLAHVANHAVPLVENMALLDQIASNAASDERRRCALDLHDTAVQPYIGLSLGLAAVRRKAGTASPLADDLERLAAMADDVIVELRSFAGSMRATPVGREPLCLSALRRQADHVERCYGVRVRLDVDEKLVLGDRMLAEVVQIVREGLSNMCRHTRARCGHVRMHCEEAMLRIEIDNDADQAGTVLPFMPRSISERAAALGGRTYVRHGGAGRTAVCVDIPL